MAITATVGMGVVATRPPGERGESNWKMQNSPLLVIPKAALEFHVLTAEFSGLNREFS
jgi:hypothetical protein